MIKPSAICQNWGGIIRLTLGDNTSEFAPSAEEIDEIATYINSSISGEIFYTFYINDKSINRLYQNVSVGLSGTGTPYLRTLHYFEDGQIFFIIYYFNSTDHTYNKKVKHGTLEVEPLVGAELNN